MAGPLGDQKALNVITVPSQGPSLPQISQRQVSSSQHGSSSMVLHCFYQTLPSKASNKYSLNLTFPSLYTGTVSVSGEVVGMPQKHPLELLGWG